MTILSRSLGASTASATALAAPTDTEASWLRSNLFFDQEAAGTAFAWETQPILDPAAYDRARSGLLLWRASFVRLSTEDFITELPELIPDIHRFLLTGLEGSEALKSLLPMDMMQQAIQGQVFAVNTTPMYRAAACNVLNTLMMAEVYQTAGEFSLRQILANTFRVTGGVHTCVEYTLARAVHACNILLSLISSGARAKVDDVDMALLLMVETPPQALVTKSIHYLLTRLFRQIRALGAFYEITCPSIDASPQYRPGRAIVLAAGYQLGYLPVLDSIPIHDLPIFTQPASRGLRGDSSYYDARCANPHAHQKFGQDIASLVIGLPRAPVGTQLGNHDVWCEFVGGSNMLRHVSPWMFLMSIINRHGALVQQRENLATAKTLTAATAPAPVRKKPSV
jgi:hypothetical protein